jgi:integrase
VRDTNKYIENWLSGLSERTKENYLQTFPKWEKWLNMNATEQIKKRLKDLTNEDLTERTFFEQKFRAYKEYLEKEGKLGALSIKTQLTHVASFFSRNGLPLALKRGDWVSTLETQVLHKFKLSLDDVKKMYAHASLRDRALLLVLAQSGFSEVDTIALKIEDLKGLWRARALRLNMYIQQTFKKFLKQFSRKTN